MASRLAPKKLACLQPLHTRLPICSSLLPPHHPAPRSLSTSAAPFPDPEDDRMQVSQRPSGRNPLARSAPGLLNELLNPFQSGTSLLQMMNTMDRLFDDPFVRPSLNFQSRRGSLRTPWDVTEDEKVFRLRMDMPGLSKEEVKVSVEEGTLVIQAEHSPPEEKGEDWSSRSYGSYNSRILLPDNVKTDEIKAELKNGVLLVTAPKAEMKKEVIDVHVQ